MLTKDDIIYVQIVDRNIVINTKNEIYTGSINEQMELLMGCFGFKKANRNKYVQVCKILSRDKKKKKIYFNAEKTIFCTITRSNLKKFFW